MSCDPNKIGFLNWIYLKIAQKYKQWRCHHPLNKCYRDGKKTKCYNCDKVLR